MVCLPDLTRSPAIEPSEYAGRRDEPRRIDTKPQQQRCAYNCNYQRRHINDCRPSKLPGHYSHQCKRSDHHTIQHGTGDYRNPGIMPASPWRAFGSPDPNGDFVALLSLSPAEDLLASAVVLPRYHSVSLAHPMNRVGEVHDPAPFRKSKMSIPLSLLPTTLAPPASSRFCDSGSL